MDNNVNSRVKVKRFPLIGNLKGYLDGLDLDDLKRKIETFRDLDLEQESFSSILDKLRDTLAIEHKGGAKEIQQVSRPLKFFAGTPLVRACPLDSSKCDFESLTFDYLKTTNDLWEPPTELASEGRYNREKAPLLYTSLDGPRVCETVFKEARLKDKGLFALVCYHAHSPFEVFDIFEYYFPPNFEIDDERLEKAKVIQAFFAEELSRDASVNSGQVYKVTNAILQGFHNYRSDTVAGWLYGSVQCEGAVNICFKPEVARTHLRVNSVSICRYSEKHNRGYVFFEAKANEDGKLRFNSTFQNHNKLVHEGGTETQTEVSLKY